MCETRREVSVAGHSAERKATCYQVWDNKNNDHAHLRRFSWRTVPVPPQFDVILFTLHQNSNGYIFLSEGSFRMDEEGQKIENSVCRTIKRNQKTLIPSSSSSSSLSSTSSQHVFLFRPPFIPHARTKRRKKVKINDRYLSEYKVGKKSKTHLSLLSLYLLCKMFSTSQFVPHFL